MYGVEGPRYGNTIIDGAVAAFLGVLPCCREDRRGREELPEIGPDEDVPTWHFRFG
jgi:hypothetical protein